MKRLVIPTLFLLFPVCLSAQKVKYKDLFVLLNAKDYKQSEPFLRRFLVQDPEHGNANLHMAFFHEYKRDQQDLLKDTDNFLAYSDSMKIFYDKAYSYIDEKEVKKNDEYYQDYYRRDLRTGKYGVKLDDVQFDIEKRLEVLGEDKQKVSSLREYFEASKQSYEAAAFLYGGMRQGFINYQHLLLTASDDELSSMESISQQYDSMNANFEKYKAVLAEIEDPGYSQDLQVEHLEGLPAIEEADFYGEEVTVYDLKGWSADVSGIVQNTIMPLRNSMVQYDEQLDELYRRTVEESATVENELAELAEQMIFDQLRNYDPKPLPSDLFNFKVDEIKYQSYLNHNVQDGYMDSLDLEFQEFVYLDLQSQFIPVERAYGALAEQDVIESRTYYGDFIEARYGSAEKLITYITNKGEDIQATSDHLTFKVDSLQHRMRWIPFEDDSISLAVNDSLLHQGDSGIIRNITVDVDTLDNDFIVSGVQWSGDSIRGFTARVNRQRELDTLLVNDFQLLFKEDTTNTLTASIYSLSEDATAVVFFGHHSDSDACQVTAVDRTTGAVIWDRSIDARSALDTVAIDEENSQITLVFKPVIVDDGDGQEVERLEVTLGGDGKIMTPE